MHRYWSRGILASLLMIMLLATGTTSVEALTYMNVTAKEGTFGSAYSSDVAVKDIYSGVAKLKFTINCTAGSVEVLYRGGGFCNESVVVGREFFSNNSYTLPVEIRNISSRAQKTGIVVEALNDKGVSLAKKTFIIDQYAFTPIIMKTPLANQLLVADVVVEWNKLAGTLADYYTVVVTQGERMIFEGPVISKLKPSKYTIPRAAITSQVSGTNQLKVSVLAYQKNTRGDINVGNGEQMITFAAPGSSTGGIPVYTFDVTTSGPGTVSGAPGPYAANGTVVTLTATPATGNVFKGWSGSCTGMTATCVITVDGPESVTARFGVESYQEAGGLVVIEAENVKDFSDNDSQHYWEVVEDGDERYLDGATGGKYLHFVSDWQAGDPRARLSYKFTINQSGYYQLYFRSHKNTVGTPDSGNDAFVRVLGEEGTEDENGYFFGAGTRVGFDADVDSLHDDVKIASGSGDAWTWAEWVYPGGKKRAPIYKFDTGRTYTLEVSGRSGGLDIDRIMFRKTDTVPGLVAKNYTHPESSQLQPVNPNIPAISFGTTRVRTTERINVRQTPSLSGALVAQTAFGETGTVVAGPQVANNFTWWQIRYDNGITGWSGEDNLELVPSEEYAVSVPLSSLSAGNTTYGPYFHIASISDLSVGMSDPGVAAIQRYLNANGFPIGAAAGQPGSVGYESSYFGPATQAALARFQAARGISPANGSFGPQTRAAMSR